MFATPSRSDSYDILAEGAARAALGDASVDLAQVLGRPGQRRPAAT
jgi:sterol carrier protein 2